MSNKTHSLALIIPLLGLLLFSCNTKTKENIKTDYSYRINIRKYIEDNRNKLMLSDFGKKLNYIPLETNNNCLLRKIKRISICDKYIYVSDGQKLFRFNSNGKYVNEIGSIGKGPSEHSKRFKFRINHHTNEIFIFDYSRKMIVYDLISGNYKRYFKVNFEVSDFEVLNGNKIIYFTTEANRKIALTTINEIYISDLNGKIIDSIENKKRLKINNNFIGYVHLYKYDNSLYYMGVYKNILYQLDGQLQKKPYVVFNFENKVKWENLIISPSPEIAQKLSDYLFVSKILENSRFFFLSIQFGIPTPYRQTQVIKYFLYDKQQNKTLPNAQIVNNIDNGLSFWPKLIYNNKLVTYISAFKLIEHYNNTDKNELSFKFKKMIKKLHVEDNPVIILLE